MDVSELIFYSETYANTAGEEQPDTKTICKTLWWLSSGAGGQQADKIIKGLAFTMFKLLVLISKRKDSWITLLPKARTTCHTTRASAREFVLFLFSLIYSSSTEVIIVVRNYDAHNSINGFPYTVPTECTKSMM